MQFAYQQISKIVGWRGKGDAQLGQSSTEWLCLQMRLILRPRPERIRSRSIIPDGKNSLRRLSLSSLCGCRGLIDFKLYYRAEVTCGATHRVRVSRVRAVKRIGAGTRRCVGVSGILTVAVDPCASATDGVGVSGIRTETSEGGASARDRVRVSRVRAIAGSGSGTTDGIGVARVLAEAAEGSPAQAIEFA